MQASFIVGNKQFQLFGQEFFDGDSIDHCLQTGTHSVEDILSILIDLEKELTKKRKFHPKII